MPKKKATLSPDENAALPPAEAMDAPPVEPEKSGAPVEVVVVRSLIFGASTLTTGGRVTVPATVAEDWINNGLAKRA